MYLKAYKPSALAPPHTLVKRSVSEKEGSVQTLKKVFTMIPDVSLANCNSLTYVNLFGFQIIFW